MKEKLNKFWADFVEWWNYVVMDKGPSGWIWRTGLLATLVFIPLIIWARVGWVNVRVITDEQIPYVQLVSVLDDELEEPTREAIQNTNREGCYFVYTDHVELADIVIDKVPFLTCDGNDEAVGCAHHFADDIDLIEVVIPGPLIIEHELLHEHFLMHPIAPPTGHILHTQLESIGDDRRGVAEACTRTRGYEVPPQLLVE